ncbi:Two-component response regulator [plant metagenome]|uniref:Two-component response regulator n=1 Tax=plant metagenome TaxID=1297885 RepID=A0A484U2Q2_9ZZZZ
MNAVSLPGSQHLVLLVDDLPDNLKMLSDALDAAGYRVLVATDGQSALARLDYVTPDIVLLDALMPGLDGFETCRRMKAHPRAGHVPVVFMTGLAEPQHVVRGFEAGGIDYVTKPLDTGVVLARLGAHLRSHRVMAAAEDAIDAVASAVIVLDARGHAIWMTASARGWLAAYYGASADDNALPPPVQDWIGGCLRKGLDSAACTLQAAGTTHVLSLRLAQRPRVGGHDELMLLLEERPLPEDPRTGLARAYHLTAREMDVLLWLSRGKTNRDISEILGISPRTANKHLEHIFVKLGVETRAAAASLATRHLHGGGRTD